MSLTLCVCVYVSLVGIVCAYLYMLMCSPILLCLYLRLCMCRLPVVYPGRRLIRRWNLLLSLSFFCLFIFSLSHPPLGSAEVRQCYRYFWKSLLILLTCVVVRPSNASFISPGTVMFDSNRLKCTDNIIVMKEWLYFYGLGVFTERRFFLSISLANYLYRPSCLFLSFPFPTPSFSISVFSLLFITHSFSLPESLSRSLLPYHWVAHSLFR